MIENIFLKFEADDREFAKKFEITRTVKGQNNFWYQNVFLTCSWRFLRSNKLEQLEFKLEEIIGIQKHQEKFEKNLI